nr:toxin VasX [uncultured Halomonas sp.]
MSDDLRLFEDEDIELGVRRRIEYRDEENGTLVLSIPRRQGDDIVIPLFEHARATTVRDTHQDNTLIRVRPLAALPTIDGERGVAMIRPGYLYVFFRGRLWRELEIDTQGRLSDIDVAHHRQSAAQGQLSDTRDSEGQWLSDILLPVLLQGQSVLHEVRIAYSEIAWSWAHIDWLERHPAALAKRTQVVDAAYAAALEPGRTLASGFPAQRIEGVVALRTRDMGIELMLDDPAAFNVDYTAPPTNDLCTRLRERWQQNSAQADNDAPRPDPDMLALQCEPGDDLLQGLRGERGLVAVAIADPLFQLRHALTQLHLSLHYLDALDTTLANQPLAHSAVLIRQALFDSRPDGQPNPLADYRDAIDRDILDGLLEQHERDAVVARIDDHVTHIARLVDNGGLAAVLRDYTSHDGLGIVEAYALSSDLIGVLQQLPSVVRAQGSDIELGAHALLEHLLTDDDLLALWAPREGADDSDAHGNTADSDDNDGSGDARSALLRRLAADTAEIDDTHLAGLGLQGLGLVAQQLSERQSQTAEDQASLSNLGKVQGVLSAAAQGWSYAVLTGIATLGKDPELIAVKFERIFQAVAATTRLTSAGLDELRVMQRGDVELARYSIIGVYGEGLKHGLTPADRRSEALSRRNDYLYADLFDDDSNMMGSTSPSRMAEATDEAIRQTAGHGWVYVLPLGHPEAQKFSALKMRVAEGTRRIVDGPGLSKVLVGLAIYNLMNEGLGFAKAFSEDTSAALSGSKAFSALADLTAASMKLHLVLTHSNLENRANAVILRPLFDIKPVPLIGSRLMAVGAETIVNTLKLANFFAGVITVGISSWAFYNSLSRDDNDAALGHSVAIAGGLLFLGAPLMAGLLLIPGWGWAALGLGLILGGGTFAALVTDSPFERLLKQGPFGTAADAELVPANDAIYFPQLLTLLSPLSVEAQRYGEVPCDPALTDASGEPPSPNDYVVTIATPLISRFKTGRDLGIVIQELEYTHSTSYAGNALMGPVDNVQLTGKTDLKRITARQSLPQQSAVRFVVKRDITDEVSQGLFHTERRFSRLRVAIQAELATEVGPMVYPTPILERYQAYQPGEHSQPPDKQRAFFDPFENDAVPYWSIKEVDV